MHQVKRSDVQHVQEDLLEIMLKNEYNPSSLPEALD